MQVRRRAPTVLSVALALALASQAAAARKYCRDFPTYQAAAAYCLETYGTLLSCGGLDRDRDGLPCECNPGGARAHETACRSWQSQNESRSQENDEPETGEAP